MCRATDTQTVTASKVTREVQTDYYIFNVEGCKKCKDWM